MIQNMLEDVVYRQKKLRPGGFPVRSRGGSGTSDTMSASEAADEDMDKEIGASEEARRRVGGRRHLVAEIVRSSCRARILATTRVMNIHAALA